MKNTIQTLLGQGLLALLIFSLTVSADEKPLALQEGIAVLLKRVGELAKDDQQRAIAEYLKGAQQLVKIFPNEVKPRAMILDAASATEDQVVKRTVIAEIATLKGVQFESVASTARGMLWQMDDPAGKPVAIKFTAVDGRQVDLSKMKGKVVLVIFWATWQKNCVDEIPNLKKLFTKQHKNGFEIVGISFEKTPDSNKNKMTDPEELALSKDKLTDFLQENVMPWPQHFDGKFWNNTIAKRFGVNSIPVMWLIDANGNLMDMHARHNLEEKVEKLLANEK